MPKNNLDTKEAIETGMKEKAKEFKQSGGRYISNFLGRVIRMNVKKTKEEITQIKTSLAFLEDV
jgi:hypothetical protein